MPEFLPSDQEPMDYISAIKLCHDLRGNPNLMQPFNKTPRPGDTVYLLSGKEIYDTKVYSASFDGIAVGSPMGRDERKFSLEHWADKGVAVSGEVAVFASFDKAWATLKELRSHTLESILFPEDPEE